jgi:hypothetical protein
MKRQLMIIAISYMAIAFTSCSKEVTGENEMTVTPQPGASDAQKPGTPQSALNKYLEGLFQFNGNLKEQTAQLAEATPSTTGADLYTEDRNGTPNSAIKFNGRYGITMYDIPTQTNMSVAAWVKYDSANAPLFAFVYGDLGFMQQANEYSGFVSTPMTTSVFSGPIDDHWHHLVSTFDGSQIRFYVDGSFVGSYPNPGIIGGGNGGAHYWVGWLPSPDMFWFGSMDDLRFYSKTLSAQEVQKVYYL